MTKREWLACTRPEALLNFVWSDSPARRALTRKSRLLVCALARRDWALLDGSYRELVEVAERSADGAALYRDLLRARKQVKTPDPMWTSADRRLAFLAASPTRSLRQALGDAMRLAEEVGAQLRYWNMPSASPVSLSQCHARERAWLCDLIRDAFRGPLRPIRAGPTWLVGAPRKVAVTVYQEHRFADVPILADALEDAGCDHADLLSHLRGPGPHVRGCWALDLILGKE
jgi:hypothetical protein